MLRAPVTRSLVAIALLVPACSTDPAGPIAPSTIFEEVWSRFDSHYPFFPVSGIDWHAMRAAYDDSVSTAVNDPEAARLIGAMIGSLKDYHAELITPLGAFGAPPIPHEHHFFPAIVEKNYFASPVKTSPSSRINFALLKNGSGYIYIGSFAGVGWGGDIDHVLEWMGGVPSIVFDIRDNRGGNEEIARVVASRFFDANRVYRLSRARNGPGYGDLGPAVSTSLGPGGSRRFGGPVALITNRFNGSAAEDFVLMMRALPQVTVIGDTTLGLGSNPGEHSLSNGWTVRVPRTAQSTPDGFVYQFRGLPPEIAVAWREEDIAVGRDPYLDAAIAELPQR